MPAMHTCLVLQNPLQTQLRWYIASRTCSLGVYTRPRSGVIRSGCFCGESITELMDVDVAGLLVPVKPFWRLEGHFSTAGMGRMMMMMMMMMGNTTQTG